MARLGGDIDQLHRLQQQLTKEGQSVAALRSNLTNMINTTWWEGPAANRFKSSWQGEYSQSLARLQQMLEELGQEVQRRRDALIQVSS